MIIVGTRILKKIDMFDVGEGSGRDVITMWFSVRLHAPSLTMSLSFKVFCPIVKDSARRRHHSDDRWYKPGLNQTWMKRR